MVNETEPTADATGTLEEPAVPAHDPTTTPPHHPTTPPPHHPTTPPFEILYEDYHLLAVNKPAPMLTQAPPAVPSLEAAVKAYIKDKHAKAGGVYLGIPHRLDRPVSGVVVFARNTKAARRVHAQFQERLVHKIYWAAVEGEVTPESGTWEDWVRKVAAEARTVRAVEGEPGAKLAVLEYRVLRRLPGGHTLVEFAPRTGRMHQLRVQAAWRGHPVFGDAAYDSPRAFGPPAELPRDRVVALHARRLTLAHPTTKLPLTLEAPLPGYWTPILGDAGFSSPSPLEGEGGGEP